MPVTSQASVRVSMPAVAAALVEGARPRQWIKNLLVLAAPVSAGALDHGGKVVAALVALVAFCLLSSGTYLLNDVRDAGSDRAHPVKRGRPVASGRLPVPTAVAAGILLIAAGLGLSAAVGLPLLAAGTGYVALTSAYTLWLRDIEVLDIAAVSGCFILRAVAGGAATGVSLSHWFLIVTSFSALFVVAGKRASELRARPGGESSRVALAAYSAGYLRFVWTMAATVAVAAYCVWAFSRGTPRQFPFFELSVLPFVLGVMRYGLLLDRNHGEVPEEAVISDAPLRWIGLAWIAVFVAGAASIT